MQVYIEITVRGGDTIIVPLEKLQGKLRVFRLNRKEVLGLKQVYGKKPIPSDIGEGC